jgi:hypothetical protein
VLDEGEARFLGEGQKVSADDIAVADEKRRNEANALRGS